MHSCCQESLPYHIWELAEPFIVRAPLNTLRYQVEVTTFSYSILLCRFQSLLSLVTVLLRDHWISSPYISRFGLKFQFHLTKRKKKHIPPVRFGCYLAICCCYACDVYTANSVPSSLYLFFSDKLLAPARTRLSHTAFLDRHFCPW